MTTQVKKPHTIASGLALFSMFFGGGNLVFPILLGVDAGSGTPIAVLGLFVTAVIFPLIGLLAMMLFDGDPHPFFGRVGVRAGAIVYFIVQIVLIPVGSIPRLFTVAYGTLQGYLPGVSLTGFTLISCVVIFACTWKKHRIIDLLGYVLTPLLLLSLGTILIVGLIHPPTPIANLKGGGLLFREGLTGGYNTLDLIASFLFATLVLADFRHHTVGLDPRQGRRVMAKNFLKASLIASLLLGLVYVGLALIAASWVPTLPAGIAPEKLLNAISTALLGPFGALVASIAVAMACLTTAISLTFIFADYMEHDLLRGRGGRVLPLVLTLLFSAYLTNLGFKGIANLLTPILAILYPAFIVLAVLNICYKLYQLKSVKIPFYITILLSLTYYFWP